MEYLKFVWTSLVCLWMGHEVVMRERMDVPGFNPVKIGPDYCSRCGWSEYTVDLEDNGLKADILACYRETKPEFGVVRWIVGNIMHVWVLSVVVWHLTDNTLVSSLGLLVAGICGMVLGQALKEFNPHV